MKTTSSLLALSLLIFVLLSTSCGWSFEPKSEIVIDVNNVSDGELLYHDTEFWKWGGVGNDEKLYDINDDGTDDIRISCSFIAPNYGMFSSSVNIKSVNGNCLLTPKYDTLQIIMDYRYYPDSTFGLLRYYAPLGDTSYSDSATIDQELVVKKAPNAFNAGDQIQNSMTFVDDNLNFMAYSYMELHYGQDDIVESLSYNPWQNETDKYIGFKYTDRGKVYLGWLQVSTKSDRKVKLTKSYIERVE